MALYEFVCRRCGMRFSELTSWERKAGVRCPECGEADLREVFGLRVAVAGGTDDGGGGGCCGGACGCGH